MFGVSRHRLWRPTAVILLLAGLSSVCSLPAHSQGFVTAVPSRARVFPEISGAVAAMERDSAGRYYILATPANIIWIFSPQGKRIGQVPRAGSAIGDIQFAVDFDLDESGRILVADRAANAVEIFTPEGSLLAKVPVFAPTGVVALPDRQFAVSTLRSKHLVEIRDETGVLIRSFGDPADAGVEPDPKKMRNLGKISGDGEGAIYFAFVTMPDPTVRKYDRYGYAATEATFAASRYEPGLSTSPDDRVQFGVNFSEVNFSSSFNTWAMVGNKGDILFGGGFSPGLASHLGGGPATAQSATDSILSTGLATGPGGGGPGGRAGGAMVSAQGSYEGGDSLQLHLGGRSRPGSSGNSQGSNSSDAYGQGSDGSIFQFNASDSNTNTDELFGALNLDDGSAGVLAFTPPQELGLNSAVPGGGALSVGMRGAGGGMFGGIGVSPGLAGFGRFGGSNFGGGIGGGFLGHDFSQATPSLSEISGSNLSGPLATPSSGTGVSSATREDSTGHPGERFGGPHGGYGRDLYNFTGTVKVNLDHFASSAGDKPVITAVGVDPVSHDIWAAIGRVLAHFGKNGEYMGDYYITTPEGNSLHPSAIIVEPDRLLVASDSRGVFEFGRPDIRGSRSSVQASIVPQPTAKRPTTQQQ